MKTLYLLIAAIASPIVMPFTVKAQCGAGPTSGLTTYSSSSQIVNTYYPGTGNPAYGQFTLTVGTLDSRGNTTALTAGDLVLIIQMQGAGMNTSNTDSYGDGTAGGGSGALTTGLVAGYYEYNTVGIVSGSNITFSYPLANTYYTRAFAANAAIRNYQVVRVPRFYNLAISAGATVTAPSWNGSTGGIVVLDVMNVATINGTINVSALGFRGGGGKLFTGAGGSSTSSTSSIVALQNTDYRYYSAASTSNNTAGGAKGEGIAGTPRYTYSNGAVTTQTGTVEGYIDGSVGRGAPANAGGGASDGIPVGSNNNQYNTGGAGGANAGSGGNGGSGWHGGSGSSATFPYGGRGGSPFTSSSLQRIIMGGGGGAGTTNNSDATTEYQSSGGAGGGIIIIRAASYAGNGSLLATGGAGPGINGTPASNTDGGGGGGAGGTILALTRQTGAAGLNAITASAAGGTGGNAANHFDHGPGGGGGGGIIYSSGSFASANIGGGVNGKTRTGTPAGVIDNDYGATPGTAGQAIIFAGVNSMMNIHSTSSPCGVLPVTLISLKGLVQNDGASLLWEITNVVNLHHFDIEYSTNGIDFSAVGKTMYAGGKLQYEFYHRQQLPSIVYYRLKMVDNDGSYQYSKIITVRITRGGSSMLAYPNPTRQTVTVQVKAEETTEAGIRIINSMGLQVMQKVTALQKGDNVMPLDVRANSAGIYIIEIRIKNKGTLREKLQIIKE